jgi:hypothetical protein
MTSSCSLKLFSSSSKLSLQVLNTLKCGMSTQVIVSNKEQLRGIFPSISTPVNLFVLLFFNINDHKNLTRGNPLNTNVMTSNDVAL